MSDITLRQVKGSSLTYNEMDNNFSNLDSNVDKSSKQFFITDTDPTTTDDISKNFKIGCIWTNTSTNKKYECKDDTEGNAIWNEASFGGDFKAITENSSTGYVTTYRAKHPDNYGDIGNNAIDLSFSTDSSTAFGATGGYSVATGFESTASGDYSVAMGSSNTTASGAFSFAKGADCTASGDFSLATGYGCTASGAFSFAKGADCTASGAFSFAFGEYVTSKNNCEIAYGFNENGSGHSTLMSFSQETTDSTETIVDTITNDGNPSLEFFKYTLIATQDDNSNSWVSEGSFIVKRTTSDLIISNLTSSDVVKDDTTWNIDFKANSDTATDFDITVTGKDSTDIYWVVHLYKNIIYL